MFALDLFNTKYEKSLQEGATDNTTEHLLKPLHLRAANILTQLRSGHTTPEKVAALTKEYEDLVAKRMSILKGEHPESTNEMGYGGVVGEAGLPGNLPPEQIPGKEDLLKGKGRQTYEENIDEGFGPVGSKGLMNGNFATFMKARQNRTPVTLEIGGEEFRLTPTMMDAMAKKYLADKAASDAAPTNRDTKLIAVNNYRAFGYPQLMRAFIDGVATHDNSPPANVPGEQLPMFERTQQVQKKNSKKTDPDLGAGTARDATVQRELQKVRARHPNARSDIEALVKDEIVNQERVDQELSQQQNNIQQQTAQLAQLGSVNQQQDTKINSLQQQLATAVQSIKSTPVAPATTKPPATPVSKPAGVAPVTTPVPSSIAATLPVPQTAKDQEIYDKVQSLEKELKDKINAMASWNAIAQQDPQSNNELTALRKEVERTKKELQQQIIKLKPIEKKPTTQTPALSDPNVFDIDAWEVPGMAVPEVPDNIKTEPGTATPAEKLPIDQLDHQDGTTPFAGGNKNTQWGPKNMRGGRFNVQDVDPYEVGVHSKTLESIEPGEEMTTNELLYRAAVEYMKHRGEAGHPVDYETAIKLAAKHYHIPYRPGMVPELHAKRQELDAKLDAAIRARQAERGARKQRQLARTAPTTPEQEKKMQDYWSKNAPQATRVKAPARSLEEDQRLHVGDPIVVTAPNEFEGKTGEIYDFSPSGTFIIVDLYNHGKHSMHLSDVEYNQYANDQDEKEFWNGEDEVDEGFQDFNKVEPYAVCLAGKPVKKFDYYEEARRFHDNWKQKLYREGDKAKADKITLMPLGLNEAEDRVDPILLKALKRMPDGLATHHQVLDAAYDAYAMEKGYLAMRGDHGVTDMYIPKLMGLYKDKHGLTFNEEYTLSPAKPFRNPPGFNKQGTGVGNRLADLNRAELANIQPSKGTPVPGKEFAQGVLKDLKKVNVKEIKADPTGSWVVYGGSRVMKFKTHGGAKAYAEKHGGKVASSEFYADKIQKQGVAEGHADQQRRVFKKNGKPVGEVGIDRESSPGNGQWYMKCYAYNIDNAGYDSYEEAVAELKHCMQQGVAEGYTPDTNYSYTIVGNGDESKAYDSKEEARDAVRKLGAGYKIKRKPRTSARSVKKHFSNRNIDEESSTSSEAVEIALIRRVLVAHTDLIMNFGLDKVTQAIEEVAYNVGDVDEIGTSDVSGWIHQVKQILGVE